MQSVQFRWTWQNEAVELGVDTSGEADGTFAACVVFDLDSTRNVAAAETSQLAALYDVSRLAGIGDRPRLLADVEGMESICMPQGKLVLQEEFSQSGSAPCLHLISDLRRQRRLL